MSVYSVTELNGNSNFQKLTKLNKFYSTTKKFASRYNSKPLLSVKNISTQNLFSTQSNSMNNSKIHSKIAKSNSFMNYSSTKHNTSIVSYIDSNSTRNSSYTNISKKIKNKFDPNILDAHYISKPTRFNKTFSKLDMPKFNTFLGSKIKKKSFNFKTFDLINGNICRFLNNTCGSKPAINKSIRDFIIRSKLRYNFRNNISISDSMKIMIHRGNKGNKRSSISMINKFNKRLVHDKRENLKEYNNYINELQANLNLTKSKSKEKNRLIYE